MNRPDTGRARSAGTGYDGEARTFWGPVLGWALSMAVIGVAVVWLLMPQAADPFGAVREALRAGATNGTHITSGVPVIVGSLPPRSPVGEQAGPVPGTASGSPIGEFPWGEALLPDEHPPLTVLPAPGDVISRDIEQARGKSSQVAVAFASDGRFAVAPIATAASSSKVPALLAVAALAALAGTGGALLARGGRRRSPPPARDARVPAVLPAGTEPVAGPELRGLRRAAGQKTALARSLAELLPSMPEALAWQAEKALAEVGVRRVMPDGEPFDAALHYAVGTEPTPGGGQENTVARTVRPGYSDEEKILVYPKVVVYANDANGKRR